MITCYNRSSTFFSQKNQNADNLSLAEQNISNAKVQLENRKCSVCE